jgi:hypothetical protein
MSISKESVRYLLDRTETFFRRRNQEHGKTCRALEELLFVWTLGKRKAAWGGIYSRPLSRRMGARLGARFQGGRGYWLLRRDCGGVLDADIWEGGGAVGGRHGCDGLQFVQRHD